jgi:hypothetical protein
MKTEPKHTPGPWVSKPTASLGPQYAVYTESDGHDIAIVYDHGNTEANARLIAAAPELYSALKQLVETPEVRMEDMQSARAAIAKAEAEGRGE